VKHFPYILSGKNKFFATFYQDIFCENLRGIANFRKNRARRAHIYLSSSLRLLYGIRDTLPTRASIGGEPRSQVKQVCLLRRHGASVAASCTVR